MGRLVAEAGFTYVAGKPESDYAWRYGRTFVWQRRSCDSRISDCGPYFGPADDTQSEALS